jgi:GNAT superfamily N-acetyltransferase
MGSGVGADKTVAQWPGGMPLLAMKALTTFYRRMILMVRPLDAVIPSFSPRLPVTFELVTERDLPAYERFRPGQGVTSMQGCLARGDKCFAAYHEGRIVAAVQVATGQVYVPYLRRRLILQPGDVYSYDSFTLPAYRGDGLAPARAVHVMRYHQQEGYQRMVCLIAVENKAGRQVMQKLGYQSLGLYSYLRVGLWQRHWQQAWGEEALLPLTGTD